ncbi:MAG TPA: hypothetical protein VIJ34_09250, partial [Acidimicrobiales bacterium]
MHGLHALGEILCTLRIESITTLLGRPETALEQQCRALWDSEGLATVLRARGDQRRRSIAAPSGSGHEGGWKISLVASCRDKKFRASS